MDYGDQNQTGSPKTQSCYTYEAPETTLPCSEQNFNECNNIDETNTKILNSCPLIIEKNLSNLTNVRIEMEESNEDDSYRNATRALIKNIIIPNEYTNYRNNSIPDRLGTNKSRSKKALRISKSNIDVRNSVVINTYLPILKSTNVTSQLIRTIYKEKTKKKKSNFETAGPSRVDCELLDRELQHSRQPISNCPEPFPTNILENKKEENKNTHCELPNLTVRETVENLDLNKSTLKFEVNRNIGKRSGSPFKEIEIKREKMDDEYFSDDQIYIRNELPNLRVKEVVIETVENILDLNESTPEFEVNKNIERRSGSPFEEFEIKREKLYDESTPQFEMKTENHEDFSDNQIYIREELPNLRVKEEVIEIVEDEDDLNESTPQFEIKTEKLDHEDFSDNQIYIKNEIHEDVDDCSFPNILDVTEETVTTDNVNNNKIHPHYYLLSLKTCTLCDVYTEDMKDHVDKRHRNGIFFSCPFCDSDTRYSSRKLSYESKKHKRRCFCYCKFCDQKFPNWLEANQHTSDAHDDQVSKLCTMCGFEAPFYSNLLVHILCYHNGETLIDKCQFCDFATLNQALMQMHVTAKHEIPQETPPQQTIPVVKHYWKKLMVKCPICEYQLSSKRYLKRHMSFMHSKREASP